MGTSSSNNGTKGKSPLLPSWYDNGDIDSPTQPGQSEEQKTPESVPQIDWKAGKDAITRLSKGTSGSSVRKAAKSYVRSLGGSNSAAKGSKTGTRAARNLVSFLSGVSSSGFNTSLERHGLKDCIGKSSEEVLAKIADFIAPAGTTTDAAIARNAILETLDKLYDKIENTGGDISSLENLSNDDIKDILVTFVSTYLFEKWIYELGIAIEKNTINEEQAIELEQEISDFIDVEVRNTLNEEYLSSFHMEDLTDNDKIEEIFQTAYSTLEA